MGKKKKTNSRVSNESDSLLGPADFLELAAGDMRSSASDATIELAKAYYMAMANALEHLADKARMEGWTRTK